MLELLTYSTLAQETQSKMLCLHALVVYCMCYTNAIDYDIILTSAPYPNATTTHELNVKLCNYLDKCISKVFPNDQNNFLGDYKATISGDNINPADHIWLNLISNTESSATDTYFVSGIKVTTTGSKTYGISLTTSYYVIAIRPTSISLRMCENVSLPWYVYGETIDNCKRCNCIHLDTRCHQHSGECTTCAIGFKGTDCQESCDDGTYGLRCASSCSQHCAADCNKLNGSCDCVPGYKGDKCEQPCAAGLKGDKCAIPCDDGTFGVLCSSDCSTNCKDVCDKRDGSCACETGYIGNLCQHECDVKHYGENCQEECNNCLSECHNVIGTCIGGCIKGFIGQKCKIPCDNGTFGYECNRYCSKNCENVCTKDEGICACKPGYYGNRCDHPCDYHYFGHLCHERCDNCDNGCNNVNGSCIGGCIPGYIGDKCNQCKGYRYGANCLPCDDGTFGEVCENNCSEHCVDICDNRIGNCTCKPGYTKRNCFQRCPFGKYGVYCKYKCDTCKNGCNYENGLCIGGCLVGFTGPKCRPCNQSRYGKDCAHDCNCYKNYACNYTTGYCGRYGCAAAWTGIGSPSTCSMKRNCGSHKWGNTCIDCGACLTDCISNIDSCQHRCDGGTGVCIVGGCRRNFVGFRCDRCMNRMYGRKCQHKCGECSGTCDSITGHCVDNQCLPGYVGKECDIQCESGRYGVSCSQKCSSNCRDGRCLFVDGTCLRGCEEGWTGKLCSVQKTCANNRYYGDGCETPCVNCFGANCTINGTCINGCMNGYWGMGCRKTCISGMYGRNCENFCGRCADWAECNGITGECAEGCLGHFVIPLCTACPDGYFGVECVDRCGHCKHDELCDSYTGLCQDGCARGFQGYYCNTREQLLLEELDPSL